MNTKLWEQTAAFHGHQCPGLAIGFKACEAAQEQMGLSPAYDEEIVCVSENDACGVDAIQFLMSCTIGKGNLLLDLTGKSVYTFYNRDKEEAMRFYFKDTNPKGLERQDYMHYLLETPASELFSYKKVDFDPPERARLFNSITCSICDERAAESMARLQDGKPVCLSCYSEYTRGW